MTSSTKTYADPPAHAHHWLITTAPDGELEGRCKLCGAERRYVGDVLPGRYVVAQSERLKLDD